MIQSVRGLADLVDVFNATKIEVDAWIVFRILIPSTNGYLVDHGICTRSGV